MKKLKYECLRCGNTQYETYETEEIRAASGPRLHILNARFVAVTCKRCKHTELFKAKRDMLGKIFGTYFSRAKIG